jgi:hypothetical protein
MKNIKKGKSKMAQKRKKVKFLKYDAFDFFMSFIPGHSELQYKTKDKK